MKPFYKNDTSVEKKQQNELPQILKIYETADFATKQKAKFIYYMIISVLVGLIFLLVTSTLLQLIRTENNGIYLPALIPIVSLVFIILGCLFILIRGLFGVSTHLLMATAMLTVWLVMWFDKGSSIARLDTIIIIVALLNLAPLFITKFKSTILIYILSNIGLLAVFIWFWGSKMGLPYAISLDFLIDSVIAILFTGVVGYNIFIINKKTLDKALIEIKERKIAEITLRESELFRQRVFDSSRISIVIMDAATFEYIDCNQAATEIYKFRSREDTLGKTPVDVSAPLQYDGTPSLEKAKFYIDKAKKEGSVVFEWKHQRPDGELWDAEVHLMSFELADKKLLQFSIVDITERKFVENALQKSQKLFETLAQMSPVGIFRTRSDGHTTYVNPKWSELSGVSFEEALGNGWLKAVHPDDKELLAENWKTRTRNGEKSTAEYRFLKTDGSIVWVLGDTNPEIVDGKIIGYIGTLTNITELKLAENSLRESEERFKTLSDIASEGIMIHEDGIIVDHNPRFADILGFSNADDLIGKSGLEIIPFTPESKKIVEEHLVKKSDKTFDIEIVNSKGTIIPAATRGVEIVYRGRKANLVYLRDITDRKLSEKALKDSEESYRKLVEAFPDMIIQTDLHGKIIYGNDPFEKNTGITSKDYFNSTIYAHIHPDESDTIKNIVKEFLLNDKIHSDVLENRFVDSHRNIHWFSGRITKLYKKNQIILQVVARDITENKKNEIELNNYRNHLEFLVQERTDELATTNEELQSINEELFNQREELEESLNNLHETQQNLIQSEKMASLGVLAAGIAHEINNPLNFIQGGITAIEMFLQDNLNENKINEIAPYFDGMKEGVHRAANIVLSLNHYSRKDNSINAECDIHAVIENCILMLNNNFKHKVELIKDYTKSPFILYCNEGKIHQALLNILSNAEQAIEKDGIIEISTYIKKQHLIIVIKDNGSGIEKDIISKISDPFFTTKEVGKGTGLGLSISYKIIEEHKGSIKHLSHKKRGTEVIIELPIEPMKI